MWYQYQYFNYTYKSISIYHFFLGGGTFTPAFPGGGGGTFAPGFPGGGGGTFAPGFPGGGGGTFPAGLATGLAAGLDEVFD